MDLCSDNHDEVCYEGRTCPVCSLRDELDNEIEQLNECISDLERVE